MRFIQREELPPRLEVVAEARNRVAGPVRLDDFGALKRVVAVQPVVVC